MLRKYEINESLPAPDERPVLSVEVVIFSVLAGKLQVLLVRQNDNSGSELWMLPGGFVPLAESLDKTARRELAEKTGVTDVYLEQLYTFGEPERDPRTRVISVVYFALIAANRLQSDQNTTNTGWHPCDQLPQLVRDHATILDYARQRLRYKLEYTAVAFQLLPTEFTLSELQDVYAIILDDPALDKRNFRKKLMKNGVVVPSNNYRKTGGRPARLYRFSDDQPFESKAPRLFP